MEILISLSALAITSKDIKAQEAIVSKLELDLTSAKNKLNRMVKQLSIQKLAGTNAKVPAPKTTAVKSTSSINLKDYSAYDIKSMTGQLWFDAINGRSKRRASTEGYWRPQFNAALGGLPFPVPMKVKGYNKTAFLAALTKVQSKAKFVTARGLSPNRWTGKSNGAKEYTSGKWSWPSGLSYYLNKDVPPSRAFYNFIMGKDLAGLPTYGRD